MVNWHSWLARSVLLALWLGFVRFWASILRGSPRSELVRALEMLGVMALLYGVVLALWIRHNVRIFRKKGRGPGLSIPRVDVIFRQDYLERPLLVESPATLHDAHLVIEVRGGKKVYSRGALDEPQAGFAGRRTQAV